MKENKFVLVTGSCMFLLLMMIIFNVGGGTKMTYSATGHSCPSGETYLFENQSTKKYYCCPKGYSVGNAAGVCCPDGTVYTENACFNESSGLFEVPASYKEYSFSSEDSEPDSNVSCSGGEVVNGKCECPAGTYQAGYADGGGSCIQCPAGRYCPAGDGPKDCPNNGTSDPGSDSEDDCKPNTGNDGAECQAPSGTWNANKKECICVNDNFKQNEDKTKCEPTKTPTLTLSWSSQTIKVGEKVTLDLKSNVAGKYTMSGNKNAASTFVGGGNVSANSKISVTFTGRYVGTDNITVTFTPTDTMSGYKTTSKSITIKVEDPDEKVDPTLYISHTDKMAVGETANLILTSNVEGKFNLTLDNVEVIGLSKNEFTVTNGAAYAPVTATKVGTANITVKFVPASDISNTYNTVTKSITIKVEDDGTGACYMCDGNRALTKWATSKPSTNKDCTTNWIKDTDIMYADCISSGNSSSGNNNSGGNNGGYPSDGGNNGGYPDDGGNNSNDNGDNGNNGNTSTNPQTGNIMLFVVWIIGLGAIGYACWYFNELKRNSALN